MLRWKNEWFLSGNRRIQMGFSTGLWSKAKWLEAYSPTSLRRVYLSDNFETDFYIWQVLNSHESWVEQWLYVLHCRKRPQHEGTKYRLRLKIRHYFYFIFVMHFWNQTPILWLKRVRNTEYNRSRLLRKWEKMVKSKKWGEWFSINMYVIVSSNIKRYTK